jgi:hypothetical protein
LNSDKGRCRQSGMTSTAVSSSARTA